eukprot:1842075-Heterocapsa_arctica.AAC.1
MLRNTLGSLRACDTMEEDAVEPRGPRADQTEWGRQIAENDYIVANKNVIPTTDMETNIKVEELQS